MPETEPATRKRGRSAAGRCLILGLIWLASLVLEDGALAAGGSGGKPVGPSPVSVANERPEAALTRVELVPQASERLGITTVVAARRSVPRRRVYGGVVMTPPGRAIKVAAPSEGTVLGIAGESIPFPGTRVAAGTPLLRLLVVSAAELARARDVVEVAAARLAIAEREQSLSPTDANAKEVELARSSLQAAKRRQGQLAGGAGGGEALAPVVVNAPVPGVIRSLAVSPGQAVPAGAALLELVLTDPVWIRTPVFSGDLDALVPDADADVRRIGAAAGLLGRSVAGPPTADPTTSSVDLYFSVENGSGTLRDGERVEVALPMRVEEALLPIPYAAVVYDIQGGSWVYERIEDHVYVRRRVEIAFVEGDQAVLSRGPGDGSVIVVDGSAELFGAEFGIGR